MATLVVFHEVGRRRPLDGVTQAGRSSFGPMGIKVRTFRDPEGSNRVGVIFDGIDDMEAFEKGMETDEAAEAMKYDGVRPETLLVLVEG